MRAGFVPAAPCAPSSHRTCSLCPPRTCRERLQRALRLRLGMLEPYLASWPQALSLLAAPAAAPRTLQLYAELADVIWHAAGDASTDLSW